MVTSQVLMAYYITHSLDLAIPQKLSDYGSALIKMGTYLDAFDGNTDDIAQKFVSLKNSMGSLNKTQVENILCTQKLTKAQFDTLLAATSLNEEEMEYVRTKYKVITADTADTASKNTTTFSWKAFTAAIRDNVKAMWTWLTTNPVVWCILAAAAIGAVVGVVALYNKRIEETIQKSRELQDAYEETSAEISNNLSAVESLADEFKELSRGVDDHGNNIHLSAEEYDRYLDIVKQLVDINPALVKGYNTEGQAIIDKNAAIQNTIDLLKEQRKLELLEATSTENNWTIAEGLSNAYEKAVDEVEQAKYALMETLQTALTPKLLSSETSQATVDSLEKIFGTSLGLVLSNGYDITGMGTGITGDSIDLLFDAIEAKSENAAKTLRDNLDQIHTLLNDRDMSASINKAVQALEIADSKADTAASAYQSQMKLIAQAATGYDDLNKGSKDFLNAWIETWELTGKETESSVQDITTSIWMMVDTLKENWKLGELFAADYTQFTGEAAQSWKKHIEQILSQAIYDGELTAEQALSIKVALGVSVIDPVTGKEIDSREHYVQALYDRFKEKGLDFKVLDTLGWSVADLQYALSIEPTGWDEFVQKVLDGRDAVEDLADALSDFSGQVDKLKIFEESFDTLSETLGEFYENGHVSAETVADLIEKFGETDGLKNLISVLGDSESSFDDVREALNQVGEEFLANTDYLSGLTEEEQKWVASVLEANGVANAQEVVTNRIAAAKALEKLEIDSVTEGAWNQIDAYTQEVGASEGLINAMRSLYTEMLKNKIQTSDFAEMSITAANALLQEAAAAGASAEALAVLTRLTNLKHDYDLFTSLGWESSAEALKEEIDASEAQLNEILNKWTVDGVKLGEVTITPPDSKSSDDPWKAEFENKYNEQKHLLEMEKITLEDFYTWLEGANEEYFGGQPEYLEEYRKYTEEVFGGIRDLFNDDLATGEHKISLLEFESGNDEKIRTEYDALLTAVQTAKSDLYTELTKNKGWTPEEVEANSYYQELCNKEIEYIEKIRELSVDFADEEHQIFLWEQAGGHTGDIITAYRNLQKRLYDEAEKYRTQEIGRLQREQPGLSYEDALDIVNDSAYIQELSKQWWGYEDDISSALDAADDRLQEHLTAGEHDIFLMEQNDVSENAIIAKYRSMQDALHETAEEIRGFMREAGYSELEIENSELIASLSEQWWGYEDAINEAKQKIIDDINEVVTKTSEAVDSIQDVYDTLHSVADEFAANDGFISVDSFQKIVELGPQYMQYLYDENGLLTITEENIKKIIAAKTEQLALDNAMAYVERLRLAMQEGSVEDLNELLYATNETTASTWGLVYANLALLDLTDEQREAALYNINSMRALADAAIDGIGKSAGTLEDTFSEMKTGLDDILQYVMDMIQHEIEQQIESLEKAKETYADLIEQKKASLEASKEETDYQDEVADKVKEIAKLQERINALSLDNSREAQAEKAKLQEEMAELQGDLDDLQADHAIEVQQESLDEMQKAYEDQKDDEIELLEDSISSQEKLYRLAIDRIENNWDTLYSDLKLWNYEYGSVLESEITTAWDNCKAAAERYGNFVAAISPGGIDADIESLGTSGSNLTVGQTGKYDTSYSKRDQVNALVGEMKANSAAWWYIKDDEGAVARLEKEQYNLASQVETLIGKKLERKPDGAWYVKGTGDKLYDTWEKYVYHTGGIAGNVGTLKENELLAKLEEGEPVISNKSKGVLFSLIEFVGKLAHKLDFAGLSNINHPLSDTMEGLNRVATTNNANIHFGDVYIYGGNEQTVEKHRAINREFTNEIIKQLGIKK